MSESLLINALVGSLQEDAILVELTGHEASDMRIARASQRIPAKLTFLAVSEEDSDGAFGLELTFFKCTYLLLETISNSELLLSSISDRLMDLLDVKDSPDGNRAFFNFSNTEISVRNCSFYTSEKKVFDDKTDKWRKKLYIKVTWVPEACLLKNT